MRYQTYEKVCRDSKAMNESLDCAVKAVAIACRVSYKEAHSKMKELGRVSRKATYRYITEDAIRSFGLDIVETRPRQKSGSRYTPKTIGEYCKHGYYLAFVNGHVLPVVNGIVYDWSDGRRHHIKVVWKVTKTRR